MLHRRIAYALSLTALLLGAAACTDTPLAPSEDPVRIGVPCSQPAPEPEMTCRGDVWGW